MGEVGIENSVLVSKPIGNKLVEEFFRNGKIILKWAQKKYGAKARTELSWPNRVQMGVYVHTIMSVRFLTATGHCLTKTNVNNTHLQISIQYHDFLSGDEQVNFCAGLCLPFWCLN